MVLNWVPFEAEKKDRKYCWGTAEYGLKTTKGKVQGICPEKKRRVRKTNEVHRRAGEIYGEDEERDRQGREKGENTGQEERGEKTKRKGQTFRGRTQKSGTPPVQAKKTRRKGPRSSRMYCIEERN